MTAKLIPIARLERGRLTNSPLAAEHKRRNEIAALIRHRPADAVDIILELSEKVKIGVAAIKGARDELGITDTTVPFDVPIYAAAKLDYGYAKLTDTDR